MEMEQVDKKSLRLVWVVVGSVVVLLMVLGITVLLVVQPWNTPKSTQTALPSSLSITSMKVATKEDVQNDLKGVNDSLKQTINDQAAVKAAIDDNKQQIKVGN